MVLVCYVHAKYTRAVFLRDYYYELFGSKRSDYYFITGRDEHGRRRALVERIDAAAGLVSWFIRLSSQRRALANCFFHFFFSCHILSGLRSRYENNYGEVAPDIGIAPKRSFLVPVFGGNPCSSCICV